jgi:hypothetical protein
MRTAQRQLQSLVGDGILRREIPLRLGRKRGDWASTYRTSKPTSRVKDVEVIATINSKTTDAELDRLAKEIVAKLTPKKP